jgi:hypothetical protein
MTTETESNDGDTSLKDQADLYTLSGFPHSLILPRYVFQFTSDDFRGYSNSTNYVLEIIIALRKNPTIPWTLSWEGHLRSYQFTPEAGRTIIKGEPAEKQKQRPSLLQDCWVPDPAKSAARLEGLERRSLAEEQEYLARKLVKGKWICVS